ncbi:DUF2149 domain-containing protein [Aminipila sp.]|uniref:DUF2149 domain-containing protein n=1 Tax=Aminipila sp. TaxID=2060095 RepID=UPI00289836D2|nr:DUF2149 domain-containing protein [Aminipila sp.]
MLRNNNSLSMRRHYKNKEDINPMESLGNLVDVMLVFSCGLMIAIIMFWNVDLSKIMDVVTEDQLVEVNDLEDAIKDGSLSEDYDSKGFVYEDEKTGKMYIVKKE